MAGDNDDLFHITPIENTASLRRGLRRLRTRGTSVTLAANRKHRLAQKRIKTGDNDDLFHITPFIENTASLRRGLRRGSWGEDSPQLLRIENTASLRRGLRLDRRGVLLVAEGIHRKHRLAQKRIKTPRNIPGRGVRDCIENTASLRRGLRPFV